VVSDKMDKTVVVAVPWQQRHRFYRKRLRRTTKFHVHDEDNRCKLGDVVRIRETRPLSRTKRWRVLDILESREVAEVKPIELEEGILSEKEEEDDLAEEDS
jgi:small subunit ribosomal protein S17